MGSGRLRRRAVAVMVVPSLLLGSGVAASAEDDGTPPPASEAQQALTLFEGTFVDDDGSVFEADIEWLAAQNVTRGCTDTEFCPEEPVTRGQMAAFLHRALGGVLEAGGAAPAFTDTAGNTFAGDVAWLASSGITKGCANDRFCPDDRVTRGQMAAFLHRALDGVIEADQPTTAFTDSAGTFAADISWLSATGVTKGCSATEFCPGDPVTRGQMAAFLHRALVDVLPPITVDQDDDASGTGAPDGAEGVTTDLSKANQQSGIYGDGNEGSIGSLGDPGNVDPGVVVDDPDPVGDGSPPPLPAEVRAAPIMPVFDGADAGSSGDQLDGRIVAQNELGWSTMGWLDYDHLPYAVGQLTMQYPNGVTGNCSATIVSRKLILTAAHCLYNRGHAANAYWFQPDEFHNAWTAKPYWYAPGNNALAFQASHDMWRCKSQRFTNCSDYQFADYALIVMQPNNGVYPGDRYSPYPMHYLGLTQGYPQSFNLVDWDVPTRAIGYPTEGWFGQTNTAVSAQPWLCESSDGMLYNWNGSGLYMIAMGCHHNGGMSGGPVFRTFDGKRYVVGVVSSMGMIVPSNNGGRWFGKNLWAAPLFYTTGDWGFDDLWRVASQY